MSDGIVRGTLVGQSNGGKLLHIDTTPDVDRISDAMSGPRVLVLIPDDGSQVVVSREEWERLHGLAWVVCASVVQRVDYDGDAAFRNDVRNLLEIVKETGPRAILGTKGDESHDAG